jgi:hypothetical protein
MGLWVKEVREGEKEKEKRLKLRERGGRAVCQRWGRLATVLLATTNHVENLDPRLHRGGPASRHENLVALPQPGSLTCTCLEEGWNHIEVTNHVDPRLDRNRVIDQRGP